MKNIDKKEVKEQEVQNEIVTETEEKNSDESSQTLNRILALEEKINTYSEKIDLIVSYLESVNKAREDEVTENVIKNETSGAENNEKAMPSKEEAFAKHVYEMARKDLYSELLPLVECAKKYKNREERDKVIKMMILTEEMADAAEFADEMDEIIEKYPALKKSDDLMEKYVTAYVILKGRDACCNNKKMTTDDLMELYDKDNEFKKAVTVRIREDLKKQNSVPNMNFNGGITSLNIEEKPKNMQDAKNATFRLFK